MQYEKYFPLFQMFSRYFPILSYFGCIKDREIICNFFFYLFNVNVRWRTVRTQ